jgi:Rieske Fe-S protein
MTHDGIPFIGKYSVFTPDIYVITGFGKWGMTSAMISAMILRDELCGVENVYEELFRPQRILFKVAYKNFVTDVGMSLKGLARGWLGKSKRCAHMGCGLVWNPDENSWDCPCHGSRFDPEGNLLGNPSKKDISTK